MRFPNVGPDVEQRREEPHLAAQDTMNENCLQVKEPNRREYALIQHPHHAGTCEAIPGSMPAPLLKANHLCTPLTCKKV